MKTFELRETNMPGMFKSSIASELVGSGINGNALRFCISDKTNETDQRNDTVFPFSAFIATCAHIMSSDAMKSKEHKTALVFSDPKGAGSMLMACISEWIPTEDGDGNYNFYFTFDQEDIKGLPEDAVKPFYQLQAIKPYAATFRDEVYNTHSRQIDDEEIINGMTVTIVKTICNWLDENASENEPISVEFKDSTFFEVELSADEEQVPIDFETYKSHWVTYATATVTVERGIKRKSMTFGEEMKAIAKGNADLT